MFTATINFIKSIDTDNGDRVQEFVLGDLHSNEEFESACVKVEALTSEYGETLITHIADGVRELRLVNGLDEFCQFVCICLGQNSFGNRNNPLGLENVPDIGNGYNGVDQQEIRGDHTAVLDLPDSAVDSRMVGDGVAKIDNLANRGQTAPLNESEDELYARALLELDDSDALALIKDGLGFVNDKVSKIADATVGEKLRQRNEVKQAKARVDADMEAQAYQEKKEREKEKEKVKNVEKSIKDELKQARKPSDPHIKAARAIAQTLKDEHPAEAAKLRATISDANVKLKG